MTTLAVTSVSSLLCHASTCFRIGSKLRCIRSTPTEMQSTSENDFECFASTGVNAPETTRQILCGQPLRARSVLYLADRTSVNTISTANTKLAISENTACDGCRWK